MSASSVTPIPPCICTASFVTNFDVNPNLDLAKLASSDKFLSFESIACKAFKTIDLHTQFHQTLLPICAVMPERIQFSLQIVLFPLNIALSCRKLVE